MSCIHEFATHLLYQLKKDKWLFTVEYQKRNLPLFIEFCLACVNLNSGRVEG
jgi:hypothetical protein